MAAEAVSARMAPPSWTSFLRTPLLGTSRLKPAALLASRRQTVSLVHPTWSGHADAAHIKLSRGKASTSAEVLSPVSTTVGRLSTLSPAISARGGRSMGMTTWRIWAGCDRARRVRGAYRRHQSLPEMHRSLHERGLAGRRKMSQRSEPAKKEQSVFCWRSASFSPHVYPSQMPKRLHAPQRLLAATRKSTPGHWL